MVLEAANCTDTACLRSITEEELMAANDIMINQQASTGGGGNFGPVHGFAPAPDGDTIPDHPLALFRQGRFHKLDHLVLGSMALEGKGMSHDTDQPAYFPVMVRQIMPTASNATVDAIQSLYTWEDNPSQLAWDWTTDAVFACNAYNLARAMPQQSRRYIMTTPPATHGADSWCKIVFSSPPRLVPVYRCVCVRD
jgi:carboxylesterase type B